MEKLVVLDFSDSSVNIYKVNDSDDREPEDIVESFGHNIDNCNFMFGERITINIDD